MEDKTMHQRRRLGGAAYKGSTGFAGASQGKQEDDRNEEEDESPVQDPEAKDTSADDDPEAD